LGPRLHILMSSWSPPGYLKVSGQTAGSEKRRAVASQRKHPEKNQWAIRL
jgi:hypothetical protein